MSLQHCSDAKSRLLTSIFIGMYYLYICIDERQSVTNVTIYIWILIGKKKMDIGIIV